MVQIPIRQAKRSCCSKTTKHTYLRFRQGRSNICFVEEKRIWSFGISFILPVLHKSFSTPEFWIYFHLYTPQSTVFVTPRIMFGDLFAVLYGTRSDFDDNPAKRRSPQQRTECPFRRTRVTLSGDYSLKNPDIDHQLATWCKSARCMTTAIFRKGKEERQRAN